MSKRYHKKQLDVEGIVTAIACSVMVACAIAPFAILIINVIMEML